MAMCDYKACDLCGSKAFYDANITDPSYVAAYDPVEAKSYAPIGLAVLCSECNATHEALIQPRRTAQAGEG